MGLACFYWKIWKRAQLTEGKTFDQRSTGGGENQLWATKDGYANVPRNYNLYEILSQEKYVHPVLDILACVQSVSPDLILSSAKNSFFFLQHKLYDSRDLPVLCIVSYSV